MKDKLINAGVDWITITYPYSEVNDIFDENKIYSLSYLIPSFEYLLKLDNNLVERKVLNSRIGYKYLYIYRDSTYLKFGGENSKKEILIDKDNESYLKKYNSLCVDIGGSGIRRLEELQVDLFEFLNSSIIYNGKCSRIDLFIDLINYDVDLDEIYNKLIKCEFISNFKKFKFISQNEISKDNIFSTGKSIEFGSRESSIELCIYDKKLERENNNYKVEVENWVRFEIRFRYDKADPALISYLNILKSGGDEIDYVVKILNGVLQIKEPSSDSNKSRWPVWNKWNEWFGANKIKIKKQSQYNLENQFLKKREWFANNAYRSFTLNKLYNYFSNNNEFFDNVFIKGLEKIKSSDLDKINNQLKKDGINIILTFDDIKKFVNDMKLKKELGELSGINKQANVNKDDDINKIIDDLDLPF